MAIYTVHEPQPKKSEASAAPDRYLFVRDGFYFWAFLLGPLWMLWRRLWIVTLLYFSLLAGLQIGLWALNAPSYVRTVVWVLLALLVGFEAATLRRWTLTRHGWRNVGVVVGDDTDTAERNFFAAWSQRAPVAAVPAASHIAARYPRGGDNQIVGLFPQPGGPR